MITLKLERLKDILTISSFGYNFVAMKKVPNRNSSLTLSSQEDLKKTNSKLVAEIFIKNKIIHDLNIENSWKKSQEYSQDINYGRLFTVLQKFKVDLEKAHDTASFNFSSNASFSLIRTLIFSYA